MAVMASMPRFDRRFHFTGGENRSTVITFLMSEGLRIDSLVLSERAGRFAALFVAAATKNIRIKWT